MAGTKEAEPKKPDSGANAASVMGLIHEMAGNKEGHDDRLKVVQAGIKERQATIEKLQREISDLRKEEALLQKAGEPKNSDNGANAASVMGLIQDFAGDKEGVPKKSDSDANAASVMGLIQDMAGTK